MVVESNFVIHNLFSRQKLAVFKKVTFDQDPVVLDLTLIFGIPLKILNGCLSLSDSCLQVFCALAKKRLFEISL